MDKFKIDSHKLIYHVERVNAWLQGKNIYPIYLEITPSGGCNHRCLYCGLDFMGYKPVFLDTGLLKTRLSEMSGLGIKSIMYAGEGEPLLHKDIAEIINHTKKVNIDVAITTNGVFLNKNLLDATLGGITWIKVSMNAARPQTYAKIHRTNPDDLKKVIGNLRYAVQLKKSKGYKCALGIQILLLPENAREIVLLAQISKDIGVDYLVVKPYSQHPLSITRRYENIRYNKYFKLYDKLKKISDKNFNIIFRIYTMEKWDKGSRNYQHCLALPFWSYIDSQGNVWGCSAAYLGDQRFIYGNIYQQTFRQIWNNPKRKKLVKSKIDIATCRINCRMDEINRYLWELKYPPAHVNFI